MKIELCQLCDKETGKAGRSEDSIYIEFDSYEIGPLCEECRRNYWVCEDCGTGVLPSSVTNDEMHHGCGGKCS